MNNQYLVEVSHSPEECVRALDEMDQQGGDMLRRFRWGCKMGDHRGWAFMDGGNEMGVRNMLPKSVRDKAKIVEVKEFTADDMRAMHEEGKM